MLQWVVVGHLELMQWGLAGVLQWVKRRGREGGRERERERERDPALELCSGGGQVCCSALQCIAVHYSAL